MEYFETGYATSCWRHFLVPDVNSIRADFHDRL